MYTSIPCKGVRDLLVYQLVGLLWNLMIKPCNHFKLDIKRFFHEFLIEMPL